jgi:hypothetical protein
MMEELVFCCGYEVVVCEAKASMDLLSVILTDYTFSVISYL